MLQGSSNESAANLFVIEAVKHYKNINYDFI